ncbi:transglycosylase domain-containing protein [Bdellovibrio sp. HCB290]|uniref:transglycosylase domain-containing protein n=1 Tax=Bdellovibrio sp. HCB290 TaxID=3394356 RepID=UPI0039B4549A
MKMGSLLKSSLKIGLILFAITLGTLLTSVVGIYFVVGKDIDVIMQGTPEKLPPALVTAMMVEYPGYLDCTPRALLKYDNNNCLSAYQLVKTNLIAPRRALKYAFDSFLGTLYLINHYPPEHIAATLLERAYWGENKASKIIGVAAASQRYLNKNISELNSKDIATLFVLQRAPGIYSNQIHSERFAEEVEKLHNKLEAQGNL